MRKSLPVYLVMLAMALSAAAQSDSQRAPSTPEERKRFLEITKKLEQDPLNEALRTDRAWALKWLEDVPDVNVNMCTPVLGNLGDSRYRYAPQVGAQFGLAMASFIIEHPNQANDLNAQYMAGVEGALRAYKSILKTQPMAVSAQLEALTDLQDKGKLEKFVQERAKECSTGDRTT